MTTIPNYLALVPFNERQYAAAKAILYVEDKTEKGQTQKRYPYACALIRFFTGNTAAITCHDLKYTLVLAFDDKREMPSKNRYLAALDTFIRSRGLICPLPLSGHDIRDFFPELHYRDNERLERKIQSQVHIESRARQKAKIKAQQQHQNRLAQAEIALAFITPSEFKSWYNRFNRDGIYDVVRTKTFTLEKAIATFPDEQKAQLMSETVNWWLYQNSDVDIHIINIESVDNTAPEWLLANNNNPFFGVRVWYRVNNLI